MTNFDNKLHQSITFPYFDYNILLNDQLIHFLSNNLYIELNDLNNNISTILI